MLSNDKWEFFLLSPSNSEDTYWQTSCWIACCRCWVLTIALIFPALFDAQYGVTISEADSHESILERDGETILKTINNLRKINSLEPRQNYEWIDNWEISKISLHGTCRWIFTKIGNRSTWSNRRILFVTLSFVSLPPS